MFFDGNTRLVPRRGPAGAPQGPRRGPEGAPKEARRAPEGRQDGTQMGPEGPQELYFVLVCHTHPHGNSVVVV